jgi:hypothetical protein
MARQKIHEIIEISGAISIAAQPQQAVPHISTQRLFFSLESSLLGDRNVR